MNNKDKKFLELLKEKKVKITTGDIKNLGFSEVFAFNFIMGVTPERIEKLISNFEK